MADGNNNLKVFCKVLPKVELHAHLNACISSSTMKKLINMKKEKDSTFQADGISLSICKENQQSVSGCFNIFRFIHEITDSTDAIYLAAYNVIKEFAEDGVRYLELRSTPRDVPFTGMSKRSYMETILAAYEQCLLEKIDIIVKLLISIDRQKGLEVAKETLQLARELKQSSKGVVVGIDVSGNPTVGNLHDYIPILKEAQAMGLKLAVHLAEILNPDETLEILENNLADRIGHGVYLHPESGGSEDIIAHVEKCKIPIEFCMTSNVIGTGVVNSYKNHPLKYWLAKKHPSVICTDGKGIFNTSLSDEYYIAAITFGLSQNDLWTLSYQSIDYIFADDIKDTLKQLWLSEKVKLKNYW